MTTNGNQIMKEKIEEWEQQIKYLDSEIRQHNTSISQLKANIVEFEESKYQLEFLSEQLNNILKKNNGM